MFKWLRAKRSPSARPTSPGLDFTNPDQERFVKSLSSWRESLETSSSQGTKFDQAELNFMGPEVLAALRKKNALIKKEANQKRRAAALRSKAKAEKPAAKATTAKPAPKVSSANTKAPVAKKPVAKKAATVTKKPAVKKVAAKPASKTTKAK